MYQDVTFIGVNYSGDNGDMLPPLFVMDRLVPTKMYPIKMKHKHRGFVFIVICNLKLFEQNVITRSPSECTHEI